MKDSKCNQNNDINEDNLNYKKLIICDLTIRKLQIIKKYDYLRKELSELNYEDNLISLLCNIKGKLDKDVEALKIINNFNIQISESRTLLNVNLIFPYLEHVTGKTITFDVCFRIFDIVNDIFVLSFFDDDESNRIVQSLGLERGVTKFFVSAASFFKELDEFSLKSKFAWNYSDIWSDYSLLSIEFFFIQVSADYGATYKKFAPKLRRKEKNNSITGKAAEIKEVLVSYLDKLAIKKGNESNLVPKNHELRTIFKSIKYSYKDIFRGEYCRTLKRNSNLGSSQSYTSDLKEEFYDFALILLRDRKILEKSIDSQLTYGKEPGNKRYKIKMVDALIKKVSYNYSYNLDIIN